MLMAFWLFVACLVIMVTMTFIFPESLKDEAQLLVWKNWREPLRGETNGRGLGNYRLASVAVLVVFITLYLIFH